MKKKLLVVIGVAVLALGMVACTGKSNSNEKVPDAVVDTDKDNTDKDNTDKDNTDASNTDGVDNADNGNNEESSGSLTVVTEITDSLSAYTTLWGNYAENEKFAAMGGDYDNYVEDAPGVCGLSNPDALMNLFYIPESVVLSVDDMAALTHMMNANTYTGVILHTREPEGFADAIKDSIVATDWVCGFPDRLIVAELSNGYIAYAYGESSIMETYVGKLQATFPTAEIVHDVNLAE